MKSIRAGRGIGDSLYLQAVARHIIRRNGEPLRICSDWPDIFRPLGKMANVVPFTRLGVDIIAHYSLRKKHTDTTQFQDCCIQAGIQEPVELKLDWKIRNPELIASLPTGKPLVLVQLPRNPMGRTDGFGKELMPDCRVLQRLINWLKPHATIAQIGAGSPLFRFECLDIDLANKTSVSDLLDIASVADGFLGYCSFIVPLAESFDKPGLFVWSRKGLNLNQPYIRAITPKKILEKKTSKFLIDDCSDDETRQAAEIFLR